jgi:3-methylcrotonyl-CoA carboxylase alpha subunit
VSLTIDGQEVSFGVSPTTHDGFELEIDGIGAASIAGAELRDGDAYALVDGRAAIARTIERSDHIDVLVGGDGLTISLAGKASGAGALEGDGAGYIVAPLPGRVAVLSVTKGDKVKKGTALIVLEAMKMEHTLVAPRAGKVEEVLCKVGQMVDEGATLVTLSS